MAVISVTVLVVAWPKGEHERQTIVGAEPQPSVAQSDTETTAVEATLDSAAPATSTGPAPTDEAATTTSDQPSTGQADRTGPTLVSFSYSGSRTFEETNIQAFGDQKVGVVLRFDFVLQDPSYAGAFEDALNLRVNRLTGYQQCLTDLTGGETGIHGRFSPRAYYTRCYVGTGFAPGTYPVTLRAVDSLGNSWEKEVLTLTFTGEAWRDADGPALSQPVDVQLESFTATFGLSDLVGVQWVDVRLSRGTSALDCSTELIAGTPSNGTYRASCSNWTTPQGTYELIIEAQDRLGLRHRTNAGAVTWPTLP